VECIQNHISDVRDYIDEPAEDLSEWSDSRITKHLNKELRNIGTAIAKRNQDYFGLDVIIPAVTNTYEYEIPMGSVRRVRIYSSGVTDAGEGVYTISSTATFSEITPSELAPMADELDDGYYTWGTKFVIAKGIGPVTTGNYIQIKMVRTLADLLYGTMQSAAASTFVIRSGGVTAGTMELTSNSYLGYGVKIYNGTGEGQERRIVGDSYDGTEHTFTLNSAWNTTPSGTVYYSLTPPFPQVFEDPLTLGAAMRCKLKVEDADKEMSTRYWATLRQALDSITPRNKNGSRRLRRRGLDSNGKTIIIRRA